MNLPIKGCMINPERGLVSNETTKGGREGGEMLSSVLHLPPVLLGRGKGSGTDPATNTRLIKLFDNPSSIR